MEKSKILYIGGFELPDKNAAAHRVLNNGKALEKLGYKVVFIDVNKELDSKNIEMNIKGFERYSISYPKSNKEWLKYISSVDYLKEISNKYKNITHI